jgi:hypothetical protein
LRTLEQKRAARAAVLRILNIYISCSNARGSE